MSEDQDDNESIPVTPTFSQAKRERKKLVKLLRKQGERERADILSKCHKGKRCYLDDCPVCIRRHERAQSQVSDSIRSITGSLTARFIVYSIDVNRIKIKDQRRLLDEKKLREMKASIAEIGLQTPITVRFHNKKIWL